MGFGRGVYMEMVDGSDLNITSLDSVVFFQKKREYRSTALRCVYSHANLCNS